MDLNKHMEFMKEALNEAKKGLEEGGIPIGSVLVMDGKIVGRGHNKRVQLNNPILHGEMDCLQNAGRFTAKEYQKSTIYTTLSPCIMCSGAIALFGIPKVVIAENTTFIGAEEFLKSKGVELIQLNLDEAKEMMKSFIEEKPELWNEDIGV